MAFHPDLLDPGSLEPRRPGGHLVVWQGGRKRFEGRILFSQRVRLGDEGLVFGRVARWTGIVAARHQGRLFFYPGLFASALGAALVYLVRPREIHVVRGADGRVAAWFWAPYPGRFPAAERAAARSAIAAALDGGRDGGVA
ncbi:hypothetical protein [Dissulfurirhabdus thermomarina]|nr:hypothetical protein [Dissulfurirhabdus thermomarina]